MTNRTSTKSKKTRIILLMKAKTAIPTTRGAVEEYFKITNLADQENYQINHHINNALKAQGIMHRDQDYVLKDGEVTVDDFTGRLMMGRRYSNGIRTLSRPKKASKSKKKIKPWRQLLSRIFSVCIRNYRA